MMQRRSARWLFAVLLVPGGFVGLLPDRAAAQEVLPDRAAAQELSGRPLSAQDRIPPISGTAERGVPYTWRDGNRVRTVYLDSELVLAASDVGSVPGEKVAETGFGAIVRMTAETRVAVEAGEIRVAGDSRVAGDRSQSDAAQPVFRSRSGAVMALPGGVVLILDREWSEAQVAAFLSANGIESGRVSPLGEIPNGFVVATGPGFGSLNLANALAEQEGVIVSMPNWWTQRVPK